MEFLKNKSDLKNASKNQNESIKFFQKNFLINKNEGIENMYKHFKANILYIPQDVNASFLLPPQHYVGVNTVARVILAPKLAIGLYPSTCSDFQIYKELSKSDADILVARAIEGATVMSDGNYRQLVGDNAYLLEVKDKIDTYRTRIQKTPDKYVIRINLSILDDSIIEVIIALKYIKPAHSKIIIEISDISKIDTEELKNWLNKFEEYGYNTAVLSDFNSDNGRIQTFESEEEAIKYLNGKTTN